MSHTFVLPLEHLPLLTPGHYDFMNVTEQLLVQLLIQISLP